MLITNSKRNSINNNNYHNESVMLSGLRAVNDEGEWPLSSVFKANSCVIVSRAWENVPSAGGWRDLTPEPLVKKTCVLPDSIMMLMSTSTLLNLMLTFFPFSFRKGVFFPLFFFFLFKGSCFLCRGVFWSFSLVFSHQAAKHSFFS